MTDQEVRISTLREARRSSANTRTGQCQSNTNQLIAVPDRQDVAHAIERL